MGRAPCCDKKNVKGGPWSPEEDAILNSYVESYGTGGNWIALPKKADLRRCGKSCWLRWSNFLRPDIKHGGFTKELTLRLASMLIINTIQEGLTLSFKFNVGRGGHKLFNRVFFLEYVQYNVANTRVFFRKMSGLLA